MRTLDSTLRFSGTSQTVTTSGTSAESDPLTLREVRLVCTQNCWVNFGPAGTTASAAAGSIYLPANVVEYFHVTAGQVVAVIQDTAAGVLSVGEMTR
jgi:hypothetical protein